jgi:dihydroorotate dehydrogenase electron transfer subunit
MPGLFDLEIIAHESIAAGYRRLTLAGDIGARPGQFVQVQVSTTLDPLLRRPISVHDADRERLVLLYRVAGRGTELLSGRQAGETVNLLGPLGTGFPMENSPEAILVAGGIGAAPLFYLLKKLTEAGKRTTFLYGGAHAGELLLREPCRSLATVYEEATDDGSAGHHGFVTVLAAQAMAAVDGVVYACGPEAMLRETARLAAKSGRECFVSLEAHMACGVGACLGCVIAAAGGDGYRRVCVDGPVFPAREVYGS